MELKYKILITFYAVLLLFLQNCKAWRGFEVIFTSFPHEFNNKLMDVEFQIQNTSGTESTIDVQFNVLEDIDDILLTYALRMEENESNKYTILLNSKVHFCKFLKERTIDNTLRTIYEDILKQGNLIKTCPLKKGSYMLHKYHIDEELLPQYIPETKFYVDLKLEKASGELILKGRLHAQVDKSKGLNNLKMFSLG